MAETAARYGCDLHFEHTFPRGACDGLAFQLLAYRRPSGANQAANQGVTMADKSPRQHMTKVAKSIKEKRAEKHAKADGSNKNEIVPPAKKH